MNTKTGESVLVELFRHNTWANTTLIGFVGEQPDGVSALTAAGTFGSIGATLTHIVANEDAYLASMRGEPPTSLLFSAREVPAMQELLALAAKSGGELEQAAAKVAHDHRISGQFQGHPFEMAAWVPLLQAVNHGTEHRGHVATILGANGMQPPGVDCWSFWGTGRTQG